MTAKMLHHALLIGIDCYMRNRLPDGSSYPCLGGCVRDISLVEGFLRKTLQIPDERIVKLTASGQGEQPNEPEETDWPTYENILGAFERVTEAANPGDHVYIHYSGHGGRAKTIYGAAKGPNGVDEALVPTDIGDDEVRYLRDLEMAKLVRQMVDKGVAVMVVLDCCHSGGMTRGVAKQRGIRSIDTRVPTNPRSIVTTDQAVSMVSARGPVTRNIDRVTGLLPDPEGYTVLSACLQTESAYETVYDGETHGALTYWLLQFLPQLGTGLTYKDIADRIVAKVHTQFRAQTPVVMGEVDRVVLGVQRGQVRYTATVLNEDSRGAVLDVGRAHGITPGARFAAFARGTTDFDDQADQIASMLVERVEAHRSFAAIEERAANATQLEGGEPAIMVGPPSARLIRKVGLLDLDKHPAREELERAVEDAGWLDLAAPGGDAPWFQVAVDPEGSYEVLDGAGAPLPWLRPPIDSTRPGTTAKLVARLEHLSKYLALEELRNHDKRSPLFKGLEVELTGRADAHDPCDPFEPKGRFNGRAELRVGQWTELRIRNTTTQALNVCLFDLQPVWSAEHVWPTDKSGFRTLDPGAEESIPLLVDLPPGLDHGVDILKVFATIGTTDFRWLELPRLDEPQRHRAVLRTRSPLDPLELWLSKISRARPNMRTVSAPGASQDWLVGQVELRVRR